MKGPQPATVSLVSETDSIQPGKPFSVGVLFKIRPHWHVYWKNAGDSGMPPQIKWNLPTGMNAEAIQWPAPARISVPPLLNYGYGDQVLLISSLAAPTNFTVGQPVTLNAHVTWLVCREVCLPGKADLSITLPVSVSEPKFTSSRALFESTRKQIPKPSDDWKVTASQKGPELILSVTGPEPTKKLGQLTFFPWNESEISNSADQVTTLGGSGSQLNITIDPRRTQPITQIQGVLLASEGALARAPLWVDISTTEKTAANNTAAPPTKENVIAGTLAPSLWEMIAFAFLGGLILNLMPCVFPVLSIKILGFVEQAGKDKYKLRAHGWFFAMGVMVSFWSLVAALILLRAGGQKLGWGFQLQSPYFLFGLCTLLFFMALNFLGVFEIGESLMGVGSGLASKSGYAGSFFSGVLATIVATPCTAPFMGSAVGFAFTQPPITTFAIFTSLALGMALPYLALSHSPGLLRFLPPPGRWMETLKQAMAFPLFATVVWLIWVFGQQTGMDGVLRLLYAMLMFSLGVWVITRSKPRRASLAMRVLGLVIFAGGVTFGINGARLSMNASTMVSRAGSSDGISWEPYSAERIKELNSQGKPVFVDFTAAWCVSCQVNEKVVFSSAEVRERFHDLGIVTMKADWTNGDQTITDALSAFDRSGVPFYLLYGKTPKAAPKILPEVLSPGIVLEALKQL
jgi:thiol:disulfide interchange protein